jgi:hypothetical protein
MLTFASATDLLGNRQSKKLANNTYLRKENYYFVVRLHDTDIIAIAPDDSCILHNEGYFTKTTKERLNSYSSANIVQEKGIWYVRGIPFYDGMIIDKNGNPVNAINNTDEIQKKKKKLDIMVKKFIEGYCEWALENGIERSNGDCWLCLFGQDNNLDHIYSHVEEQYYFGSFVDVVIRQSNYNNPDFIRQYTSSQLRTSKSSSHLKRLLTTYFKKVKSNLMEFVTLE